MLSWDDAKTPVSVIAGLLTIVGGIAGYIYAAKKWVWARPRVKRVVRPDDDDLEEIWRIHDAEFVGDVADELKDLRRWVAEAAAARKKRPLRLDEFLLCVKSGQTVLGYLFAQYYTKSQLIFISYIALNDDILEAKKQDTKVVCLLFNELLKQLKKQRYDWRAIVGEFEVYKRESFVPHARILMRTFQSALAKFQSQHGLRTDLFRICIDYTQPILRPEDLDTAVIDATYDQWLAFIPRDPNKVLLPKEGRKIFVDKSLVLDILRSVYLEIYFDAFPDDERYKNYLQSEFQKHVEKLPMKVELTSDFRAHLPNDKEAKRDEYQRAIAMGTIRPSPSLGC